MKFTWKIRSDSALEQELSLSLSRELHISLMAARLLVVRGITTADEARRFVRPSLSQLYDPFMMKDMAAAVERLERALHDGEKILVYGDYDVDGTTAVALMMRFLQSLTLQLDYYIPDRYTEGYGISFRGIDYAAEHGCSLMIALDCGIKAVDKVAYATQKGVDCIICDHHTPGEVLPDAVAVLNMKRKDCSYPYKELSGCGVGFKLVQAMTQRLGLDPKGWIPLLQLTAMAIASDVVPVTDENRVLAYFGLRQVNMHPFAGVEAILKVAGGEVGKVTMNDLVFKLGPRINASGRMHSGRESVQLLLSDDKDYVIGQAKQVDRNNQERRDFDLQTTNEALEILRQDPENDARYTTVVYHPGWHKGVVGIAASRLIETYYRPTIVLTSSEGDIISGSARSVEGFDLYSAIDSCRDLLTNFGGHVYAAGLSLKEENLPEFKRRFEAYVTEHIQEDQRQPTLQIESELALEQIDPPFYNVLRHLEPFGPGNPRPRFVTQRLINHCGTRVVGKGNEHLHLDLTDQTAAIAGIAFGRADMAEYICNGYPVDVCYELEENTFNHVTSIQMMAVDIRESEPLSVSHHNES